MPSYFLHLWENNEVLIYHQNMKEKIKGWIIHLGFYKHKKEFQKNAIDKYFIFFLSHGKGQIKIADIDKR